MKIPAFCITALLSISPALADDAGIHVDHAWARPAIGAIKQTAIYLDIHNTGNKALKLTGADSPEGAASLHESMAMDGGMMEMEPLHAVALQPNATLSFAPGHKHIMLEGLLRPLPVGDHVTLVLHFAGSDDVTLRVPVANQPPQ